VASVPLALRVFSTFGPLPVDPAPTPTTRPAIVQPTQPGVAPANPTAAPKPVPTSTVGPTAQPSSKAQPSATARAVPVPSLVGLKLDLARRELDRAGLVARVAEEQPTSIDEPGTVLSQSPQPGGAAQPGSTVSLVVSKAPEKVQVPEVVGQTASDARSKLESVGLKVDLTDDWSATIAAGRISAQKPQSGEQVPKDSTVQLTVSKGPRPPTATPQVVRPPEGDWAWVPDVVGLPEAEARRRIDLAGLSNTYTNYQTQDDVKDKDFFRSIAPGSVLSVTPNVGERVPKGSIVYLAVRKP